jgi:hypothetical protein
MEALFPLCWPEGASTGQRVKLIPVGAGDFTFEVSGQAENSTGWCLREIATSYPTAARPKVPLEVAPSGSALDLWAALEWVRLLAPTRFGPERGLLDPAPWAAGCFTGGIREGVVRVEQTPVLAVRGLSPLESERCLEAVLASTAWPSPKRLLLRLSAVPRHVGAAQPMALYFGPTTESGAAIEPQLVRDAMHSIRSAVSACWNDAIVRRAGLSGTRTFRFRTDGEGRIVVAWVSGGLAEGPQAADALLDRCLHRSLLGVTVRGAQGDGLYTWNFALR